MALKNTFVRRWLCVGSIVNLSALWPTGLVFKGQSQSVVFMRHLRTKTDFDLEFRWLQQYRLPYALLWNCICRHKHTCAHSTTVLVLENAAKKERPTSEPDVGLCLTSIFTCKSNHRDMEGRYGDNVKQDFSSATCKKKTKKTHTKLTWLHCNALGKRTGGLGCKRLQLGDSVSCKTTRHLINLKQT